MLRGISVKYEGGRRAGDKKRKHMPEFLSLKETYEERKREAEEEQKVIKWLRGEEEERGKKPLISALRFDGARQIL